MTGAGDEPRPMQIGEVAERTGLSLRTLRHYDEIGLLCPSARSAGGFRLYTAEDLDRLLVIRRMKPLGFSLDEMHEVMRLVEAAARQDHATPETAPDAAGYDPEVARQVTERLDEVLADARARRAKLQRQLEMADEFIALICDRLPPGTSA